MTCGEQAARLVENGAEDMVGAPTLLQQMLWMQ